MVRIARCKMKVVTSRFLSEVRSASLSLSVYYSLRFISFLVFLRSLGSILVADRACSSGWTRARVARSWPGLRHTGRRCSRIVSWTKPTAYSLLAMCRRITATTKCGASGAAPRKETAPGRAPTVGLRTAVVLAMCAVAAATASAPEAPVLQTKGLKAVRAAVVAHSPLQALKAAPQAADAKTKGTSAAGTKTAGAGNSLLKEAVDDNKIGDFSKDGNKNDKRKLNGKFDWLLKASSPLYSAAKVVGASAVKAASAAQHNVASVLGKKQAMSVAGGSSLQDEGNTTDTSDGEDGAEGEEKSLNDVVQEDAEAEKNFLTFSKDKEVYFFATWIVVLVVVLGILGLCLLYAKKCLGAEDQVVPAGATRSGYRKI